MNSPDPITRLNAALEGRYRIESELGEGGMANVYLAADLKHERNVALKVLKPELAAVVGAERFLAEIKTTANLQHPHILPLFDSGEADGFLFYVMPFVEGETLRDRLEREKQLPVDEAVRIATDVAEALQAAHEQGVIHRDIKPANILMSKGRPLVADFGIALAVQQAGAGRLTETGLSLGTPHYMSPEQATGDRPPDARSDVYSLGCVVYEMLTAEPPFPGSTAQAVLGKIVTADPTPPTQHRRSIPAHLEAVTLKALEKVPADRFTSAAEFAEALRNPTVGQTLLLKSVRGTDMTGAKGGARLMAVAVAVLAVLAVWGWLRPMPEERVSRYSIVLPRDQALAVDRGGANALALMPDGSGMIYTGPGSGADERVGGLWFRPWNQDRASFIEGTQGAGNPALSPDGSRIAFTVGQGNQRRLEVVSLVGGGLFTVTDSLVDQAGVSWGYDGYIYYDGHLEGDGFARAPETGGRPEIVTMPDTSAGEIFHMEPFALPGGAGVLFTIAKGNVVTAEDFAVGVVTGPGSRHRVLIEGGHTPKYAESGHILFTRGDQIMAALFDLDRMEVTGPEVPVAAGVRRRALGRTDYAVGTEGTLVYVTGQGQPIGQARMLWADESGRAEFAGLELSALPTEFTLSPEGERVALSLSTGAAGGYELWVGNLGDGGIQRLTFERSATSPVWHPSGETVVFSAGAGGVSGLFEVPADGRSTPRLLFDAGRIGGGRDNLAALSFTPGGDTLVYNASPHDVRGHVFSDSSDFSFPVTTGGNSFYQFATVSPDGRWLAYASTESGEFEVYVRPLPDVTRAKYLVSRNGGIMPQWSSDGERMFFIAPLDDELMAVDVGGDEAFRSGTPRRLFDRGSLGVSELSPYAVHPDGRSFLLSSLQSDNGAAAPGLMIVENFFRELREKVGG